MTAAGQLYGQSGRQSGSLAEEGKSRSLSWIQISGNSAVHRLQNPLLLGMGRFVLVGCF